MIEVVNQMYTIKRPKDKEWKNVRLFTHIDLDGVGCSILAKAVIGTDLISVEYCDYPNINQIIGSYIDKDLPTGKPFTYLVTDICYNRDMYDRLKHCRIRCITIDHHQTSEWIKNARNCYHSHSRCGTFGLYLYFQKIGYEFDPIFDEFVTLVNDWDMGKWAVPGGEYVMSDCIKFNSALYSIGRVDFISDVLNELSYPYIENRHEKPMSRQLMIAGNRAYTKDLEYCKERVEHAKILNTKWGPCCLVFADSHQSLMGLVANSKYPDASFFVKVDLGTGKLDFRTMREDLNVGLIAAEFGGGGHPKAAGAYLNEEETDNILLTLATAFNK